MKVTEKYLHVADFMMYAAVELYRKSDGWDGVAGDDVASDCAKLVEDGDAVWGNQPVPETVAEDTWGILPVPETDAEDSSVTQLAPESSFS